MDIFSIFTLLGGLAFFLFGMNTMSGSLEKIAGGKLESTLKKMTSNPFSSLVLGAGITIAVQSSSALTVMLVGLVNSGIMELSQTVGVIMGSNIGTTLTAWLLSMTGIESDNVFVKMLKPENFSPLFALIGVIMTMACKDTKKKDIGKILIGFAVLMYGMELMKDSVSPLTESDAFAHLLVAFKNPIVSVIIGAVFTGIIQSSAASVGILQALSLTGTISYGMAIPIIMGQNIGTCVTALISSIGVNRNAKRVTVVHMTFNIVGTVVCLSVFYILNAIFNFTFTDSAINPVEIAMIHSIFNVVTTIMLLPLSNYLVKFAEKIIPPKDEQEKTVLLDSRLLSSPPLAVAQVQDRTVEMGEIAKTAFLDALSLVFDFHSKKVTSVEKQEQTLDKMDDELRTYMVNLSKRELNDSDSQTISCMLHTIGDLERIGDHAINISELAKKVDENVNDFSKKANAELHTLFSALTEIIMNTTKAFADNDIELAKKIEPLEEVIDDLTYRIKDKHVERLQRGECDSTLGILLSDLLINCERVSDHCSNIAISIIENSDASLESHEYLENLKKTQNPLFVACYNAYSEKYRLPTA